MADPKATEYLGRTLTDEESVSRAVERYRNMTPAKRWQAMKALLVEVQQVLGDRAPAPDPDAEHFWKRWADPSLGRPS